MRTEEPVTWANPIPETSEVAFPLLMIKLPPHPLKQLATSDATWKDVVVVRTAADMKACTISR
jgi:hypothetical protein